MSTQPSTPSKPTLTELVRAMREGNQQSRARVLRSVERLRELADAKRRRR